MASKTVCRAGPHGAPTGSYSVSEIVGVTATPTILRRFGAGAEVPS